MFAIRATSLSKISFKDIVQRLKETETGLAKLAEGELDIARVIGNTRLKPRKRTGKKDIECYRCY